MDIKQLYIHRPATSVNNFTTTVLQSGIKSLPAGAILHPASMLSANKVTAAGQVYSLTQSIHHVPALMALFVVGANARLFALTHTNRVMLLSTVLPQSLKEQNTRRIYSGHIHNGRLSFPTCNAWAELSDDAHESIPLPEKFASIYTQAQAIWFTLEAHKDTVTLQLLQPELIAVATLDSAAIASMTEKAQGLANNPVLDSSSSETGNESEHKLMVSLNTLLASSAMSAAQDADSGITFAVPDIKQLMTQSGLKNWLLTFNLEHPGADSSLAKLFRLLLAREFSTVTRRYKANSEPGESSLLNALSGCFLGLQNLQQIGSRNHSKLALPFMYKDKLKLCKIVIDNPDSNDSPTGTKDSSVRAKLTIQLDSGPVQIAINKDTNKLEVILHSDDKLLMQKARALAPLLEQRLKLHSAIQPKVSCAPMNALELAPETAHASPHKS